MSGRPRRLFATLPVLGFVLLVVFVVVVTEAGRGGSSGASRRLEIEMQASAGTAAQLFWAGDMRFVQERSAQVPLHLTPEGFQRLRFPLPPDGIQWLRFDPTDTSGDILIAGLRLLDDNDRVIATFDPGSLRPSNQIASVTRQGALTKIVTTPAATDPSLLLAFGRVDRLSFWNNLALVTPASLALTSAAAFALLVACLLLIRRAAFGEEPGDEAQTTSSRLRTAVWLVMLFLFVFSAKLLLIRANPALTPFWDQWDGEAAVLFVPFNDNALGWRTMFSFHNEHRVFFSRLLALDLLALNGGQWDPRLEQVVNAAIHSLTGVLLTTILWVAGGRRRLDLLALLAIVTFAVPFGWENTLIGFQSAFYFLLLFSVLALWLTTVSRPGSLAWLLGWVCAACGLFTAASGVITPLAILGVVALKFAGDPREWREGALNVGAAVLVLGLGAATASPPLAHHAMLKAQTVGEFRLALARNLAWPWIDLPPASVVMWLPLAILLTIALLQRTRTTALERTAAGFGMWVVLNAGAMAYGRGAGGGLPAIRYFDILSLGFLANTAALIALLERARTASAARYLVAGALAGWMLFAALGVDWLTGRALEDLTGWRGHFVRHAIGLRTAMFTGDIDDLLSKRPLIDLPYPDPVRLVTVLKDPYIQSILPAAVRAPLLVEPRTGTSNGFVRDSVFTATLPHDPLQHAWLSLSDDGKKAKGTFESQPLGCQLGSQLKFQVSGYLGWTQQYLALRDLRTGRDQPIVPRQLARESWNDVIVPCPSDQFEIVAIDNSEDSWFGFREPVEVGRASVIVESLIQNSRSLLVALMTVAILGVAVRWP